LGGEPVAAQRVVQLAAQRRHETPKRAHLIVAGAVHIQGDAGRLGKIVDLCALRLITAAQSAGGRCLARYHRSSRLSIVAGRVDVYVTTAAKERGDRTDDGHGDRR
jgi:hypothetical protein